MGKNEAPSATMKPVTTGSNSALSRDTSAPTRPGAAGTGPTSIRSHGLGSWQHQDPAPLPLGSAKPAPPEPLPGSWSSREGVGTGSSRPRSPQGVPGTRPERPKSTGRTRRRGRARSGPFLSSWISSIQGPRAPEIAVQLGTLMGVKFEACASSVEATYSIDPQHLT